MSTSKKPAKNMDDTYAALQSLIAKGRKEGMIRTNELNAQLEKMDLTPEKIEEIYDRFESMNIQIVGNELELELDDDLDLGMDDGLGGDVDLSGMDDEDLVDPVDLAAEYSLDDPVRMYLKANDTDELSAKKGDTYNVHHEHAAKHPCHRKSEICRHSSKRLPGYGAKKGLCTSCILWSAWSIPDYAGRRTDYFPRIYSCCKSQSIQTLQ